MGRYSKLALASLAGIAATYLVYDLLTTSDAERLARFASDVTGSVTAERIEHALGHVDLEADRLRVSGLGMEQEFGPGDDGALKNYALGVLNRLDGDELRVLGKSVSVEGEHGAVSIKLLSRFGMGNVKYRLRKRGERWNVTDVRLER